MGGRGSYSGGGPSGVRMRSGEYFFTRVSGKDYIKRTVTGIPQPIPGGMSKSEFIKRAMKNGATPISRKDAEKARNIADAWRNSSERADLTNDVRHGVGSGNGGRYRKVHSNGKIY